MACRLRRLGPREDAAVTPARVLMIEERRELVFRCDLPGEAQVVGSLRLAFDRRSCQVGGVRPRLRRRVLIDTSNEVLIAPPAMRRIEPEGVPPNGPAKR